MKKSKTWLIKFLSFFGIVSGLTAIITSCASIDSFSSGNDENKILPPPNSNTENQTPGTTNNQIDNPTYSNTENQTPADTTKNEINQIENKFKITPFHSNSQTGISDVISYQAKTNNVSVFFIKRNGAFIAVQELLSVIYLKQLNPNKQVYFYIGSPDVNDDSANGKKTIGYEELAASYKNFHFGELKNTKDNSLHDTDLTEVIKNLKPGQKIDLFVEDYAITEPWHNQYLLSKNLIKSWPKINSVTFPTDGSYNLVMNKDEYNWYQSKTSQEINSYLKTWSDLFEGKVNVNDKTIKWNELSRILPMLANDSNNPNLPQKINVWNATNQGFKDWTKGKDNNPEITENQEHLHDYPIVPAVLNQYSIGFGDLWKTKYNEDSKSKFEKAYKMNLQDLSFTKAKENHIVLGLLMQNNPTSLNFEKNRILQIYKANKKDPNDINIIYKGHPRENSATLTQLKNLLKQADPSSINWFHVIDWKIPFEVFLSSGKFDDDALTKTSFKFYLLATSTVSQVFYDYGGSQDQVAQYFFAGQKSYDETIDYYGLLSPVFDFNKKVIQEIK